MKTKLLLLAIAMMGVSARAQKDTSTYLNELSLNVLPFVVGVNSITDYSGRIYIDYARQIQPNLKLQTGISGRFFGIPFSNPIIIYQYETDSNRSYSARHTSHNQYLLRLGAERTFINGKLSIGAKLLNGYLSIEDDLQLYLEKYDKAENTWMLHSDSSIQAPYLGEYSGFNSSYYVTRKEHYYATGIELNIGLNLPITRRWVIGLDYAPQYVRRIFVKHSEQFDITGYYAKKPIRGSGHFRSNLDLTVSFLL